MTSSAKVHDPRYHTVCAPHYGEKGEPYTRRFRPDFIANLWSETDDTGSSLAEYLLNQDDGSPAQPIPAGGAAALVKRRRLRTVRAKRTWKLLRLHIEE